MVDLASSLAELGDINRAVQIGEEVLPDLVALLGDDHPHTLACAANLALDLRSIGMAPRASEVSAKTLERYHRLLGDEHPKSRLCRRGSD